MKIPSREELVMMLDCINPREPFGLRDRAVIVLMANTGLRVSELAGLDVHHVLGPGQIRTELDIPRQWAKGKCSRTVPLNASARKAVACLLRFNQMRGFSLEPGAPLVQDRWHRRVPVRSLQRMMQRYRERAKASHRLTPHALRQLWYDLVKPVLRNFQFGPFRRVSGRRPPRRLFMDLTPAANGVAAVRGFGSPQPAC